MKKYKAKRRFENQSDYEYQKHCKELERDKAEFQAQENDVKPSGASKKYSNLLPEPKK